MSTSIAPRSEQELLALAQQGDRSAFDELMSPLVPKLRQFLRRMVGNPHDADDLVQDTLVRAYTRLGAFRGDSKLTTWLYAIASRLAIDHLASRRLAADAKLRLRDEVHASPVHLDELRRHLASESTRFDAREHIAFCFGCVSRSLPPDEQAALVLRDVLELSNEEAARVLDVTTSVLRHRLASARGAMQARYEGLCRLVSKTGVCHQCEGLREAFPEERQGPPVPVLAEATDTPRSAYRRRLAVVRSADVEGGAADAFHAFLWRVLASLATG
jgi:RNA polymerase sigma-70 factor (ECF subfamily)